MVLHQGGNKGGIVEKVMVEWSSPANGIAPVKTGFVCTFIYSTCCKIFKDARLRWSYGSELLFTEGDVSLLSAPSPQLQNLASSRDGLCRRPLMAFLIQSHNLEALAAVMKMSLRRGACRIYAFQVVLSHR